MTVTIRQLEGSPGEYFASLRSLCGKATYFAYFHDDILGAVALLNFVEMLRKQFGGQSVEVKLLEDCIRPKSPALLEALRDSGEGGSDRTSRTATPSGVTLGGSRGDLA